jgi:hypothetical protein
MSAAEKNRFKLYALKANLKGRVWFDVEYAADGVKVLERDYGLPTEDDAEFLADDMLWGKRSRALYGPEKNIPLFVKMSLACIQANNIDIMEVFMDRNGTSILNHEELNPLPGVTPERFKLEPDDLRIAVFVIELDGELTIADLNGVMVRLLQLRVECSGTRIHGVCIVNHQQHLAPARREAYTALDANLSALLASCDLSLVFATDVARYINAAREHEWPLTPIRDGIKGGGYVPCWPPNSTYVGEVIKVFPKLNVLGLNVDANPPREKGDQVFVHCISGFECMTVESIEGGKKPLDSVSKGEAGVKVSGDVRKVAEGAFMFRAQSHPFSASEKSGRDSRENTGDDTTTAR